MDNILFDKLVKIRRQIHQFPELGFQEIETANIICNELDSLKIPYRNKIAKTGVIGELTKGEGPCIALRADIDALPIQENTNIEFSSSIAGKMHACGHDLHTTMLLGAAHILKERDFKGTIKFIFQPSEEGTYKEVYGDNQYKSGGQRIVEAGELNNVSAALGLHVHPLMPTGTIGYKLGQSLAGASYFKITIIGKGGHAAFPEKTIDPILISSQLITSAQYIVSRYTSATQPKVISFTKIEGGVNENIIPGEVIILGTIRALDRDTYHEMIEDFKRVIKGIESLSKAQIDVEFTLNYPSLLNDSNIHSLLISPLEMVFGSDQIEELEAMMAGEDFAFYSRKAPSMFYFLGANNGSNRFFLHHPEVVFDEECIKFGSEFLANGAIDLLNKVNTLP